MTGAATVPGRPIEMKEANSRHHVTVVVTGFDVGSREAYSKAFDAGFDDAEMSVRDGLSVVEFSRHGPSLPVVLLGALRDLGKAGARVVHVETGRADDGPSLRARIERERAPPPDPRDAQRAAEAEWVKERLADGSLIRDPDGNEDYYEATCDREGEFRTGCQVVATVVGIIVMSPCAKSEDEETEE